MNIDKFIAQHWRIEDEHNTALIKAIKKAYHTYQGMEIEQLQFWQKQARKKYITSCETAAACLVLHALIEEAEEQTDHSSIS